jgi:hypothetical protein
MGVYIWYAALWRTWVGMLENPGVPKPPGLEEGVRLEHEHLRAAEYFPHLSRGPDYCTCEGSKAGHDDGCALSPYDIAGRSRFSERDPDAV